MVLFHDVTSQCCFFGYLRGVALWGSFVVLLFGNVSHSMFLAIFLGFLVVDDTFAASVVS